MRALLERQIDDRIDRDAAALKQLRREAMGLLVKFVAETPKTAPDLPEALLRLGELEWEDQRDQFLEKFKRWEATPGDQRGEPPEPDYHKSRERFLQVLREHKNYRRYDLALYIDGFLATEMGKHEEALERFNKLLAWFPKSRFVPDAHMVRAEYEFTKDNPDYQVAYNEYEAVLRYKDSDLYDIALFKSGWCLWRLGQTDEAARRFLVVFKKSAEAGANVSAKRRAELDELQAEALKNLVAVFAEDEKNSADDMYKFLVKAGGEKFAGEIVRALANAFYEQSQYERGIEAYRLLLKLEPLSPHGYELRAGDRAGPVHDARLGQAGQAVRSIIADYTVPPVVKGKQPEPPSAWARSQPESVLRAAETAIEAQMKQDAVSLHAKAQADKTSRAEFLASAHLYETYLSRFSSRPEAYELDVQPRRDLLLSSGRRRESRGRLSVRRTHAPGWPAVARCALQRPRRAGDVARRGVRGEQGRREEASRDAHRQEAHRGDGALRPHLPERQGDARAPLSPRQALLRLPGVRPGGAAVGSLAREVSAQSICRTARASSSSTRSTRARTTRTSRPGRAA